MGQIGIELSAKVEGTASIRIENLDWSDMKKIGKRNVIENSREVDDFSYEISLGKLRGTSAAIEYIVSPNIIDINNLLII